MNGDHWLLYVTAPRNSSPTQVPSPTSPSLSLPAAPSSYASNASVLSDAISSAAIHLRPASPSATSDAFPPPQNHTKPLELVQIERKHVRLGNVDGSGGDQTLEILMTHLSEKGRNQFYPPKVDAGQPPVEEGYEGGKLMSFVFLPLSFTPCLPD